ncbi:MAG: nuclear transport factor 2 family protein [Sciscionella sp.]
MSETDETRRVLVAFNAARDRNDAIAIAALVAEDVEWHPPESVRNRPIRGRDRVTSAMTGGSTSSVLQVDTIKREVVSVVVENETAAVRQLMTATRVDGEQYRNNYCWIYTVENGLIRRIDEYGDTLLIARAGFIPLGP